MLCFLVSIMLGRSRDLIQVLNLKSQIPPLKPQIATQDPNGKRNGDGVSVCTAHTLEHPPDGGHFLLPTTDRWRLKWFKSNLSGLKTDLGVSHGTQVSITARVRTIQLRLRDSVPCCLLQEEKPLGSIMCAKSCFGGGVMVSSSPSQDQWERF